MSWTAHDPITIARFSQFLADRHGWKLKESVPWKEGASNAIWSFDTEGGRYVLKVGKLDYWRRLNIEASILSHLDGQDVPRLVDHGDAGEQLPWDWALLERVEGIHPFALVGDDVDRLGELLVRIRMNTASLRLEEGGWRRYFQERVLPSFQLALPGMPTPLAELFQRRVEDIGRFAHLGDRLDGGASIAHGDITPYNLIKKPDGTFCLLDWEQPRRAAAAWDLATVRKAFRMPVTDFQRLKEIVDPELDDEVLSFADILYQMQVCSWRAEMLYGRHKRYDDFFIVELGEELARAELLLRRLQDA